MNKNLIRRSVSERSLSIRRGSAVYYVSPAHVLCMWGSSFCTSMHAIASRGGVLACGCQPCLRPLRRLEATESAEMGRISWLALSPAAANNNLIIASPSCKPSFLFLICPLVQVLFQNRKVKTTWQLQQQHQQPSQRRACSTTASSHSRSMSLPDPIRPCPRVPPPRASRRTPRRLRSPARSCR